MEEKKLKLKLRAFSAKPIPPIGPVLSSNGVSNIVLFCRQYNELTKEFIGLEIPVKIIIREVNKYSLVLMSPSLSFLILLFSSEGKLKLDSFKTIYKIKRKDLYPLSKLSCFKIFKGTLNSMGINIVL